MKFKQIKAKLQKIGKFFKKFKKTRVIFIESNQTNHELKQLNNSISKILPEEKRDNVIIMPSSSATELKITKKWL